MTKPKAPGPTIHLPNLPDKGRSFLGQSVGLADGGIKVDGQGRIARSATSRPGPGQHHPHSRIW